MFTFSQTDHAPLQFAGTRIGRLRMVRPEMPRGFSLSVVERTSGRTLAWAVFDARLYGAERVDDTLRQFKVLLEKVLDDPTRRLSELLPARSPAAAWEARARRYSLKQVELN
jgi:hypothetical protein